jgi:hypothetical protein
VGVGLEEEPDTACPIRSLTTFGVTPAFSAPVAYEVRRSWKGDPREPRGRGEAVEARLIRTSRHRRRTAVVTRSIEII